MSPKKTVKKKAAKKATPKSAAKKTAAKKAAPAKGTKKAAVKKAAPAKGTKKAAVKKAAVKKAAVKKAAPAKGTKKAAVKKTAVKKAAPAKGTKKAAVKKTAVKKAAPAKGTKKVAVKKAAPKNSVKEKVLNKTVKKTTVNTSSAKKSAAPGKSSATRLKKFQMIRENLLQQRQELLSEAESAMNALPEQTVFPDLGDQASAEADRNFMLKLRGREQRLLNKIEEAIERIDNENFGICDMCGEEIGVARLIARPVASLCIDCKVEQEEEEKLQGG